MASERQVDEFLNTPAEIHAIVHGLYSGVYAEPEMVYEDSKAEPHYYRAGYLLGALIRWVKYNGRCPC